MGGVKKTPNAQSKLHTCTGDGYYCCVQVEVPKWQPLLEMHPCDFQSSMLKGCTPSDADAAQFYSEDRRREIRAKSANTASVTHSPTPERHSQQHDHTRPMCALTDCVWFGASGTTRWWLSGTPWWVST